MSKAKEAFKESLTTEDIENIFDQHKNKTVKINNIQRK